MSRSNMLALVLAAGAAASAAAQVQGPSTLQPPYMLPSDPASGVVFWSIASNGNGTLTPNETFPRLNGPAPYRLVGIPDGMGLFRTPQDIADDTVSLLCNHELGAAAGIVRDHGSRGALVSIWRLRVDAANLNQVVGGQDLTQRTLLWNNILNVYQQFDPSTNGLPLYVNNNAFDAAGNPNPNPNRDGFGRFCSADLAPVSAYQFGTLGTDSRILLNGEEIGATGRAFAHIATGPSAGTSVELPDFGDYSWENAVSCPFPQAKTVTVGLDDSTPGNIYVHIGTKSATGSEVEKAGLFPNRIWGIVIQGVTVNAGQPVEDPVNILGNAQSGPVTTKPFTMFQFPDARNLTGAQLQTLGDQNGVMNWLRPEDGHWDTIRPNRFYFVTTASFTNPSRLWALDFTDIAQPELGGVVTMLGDGNNPASWAGGIVSAPGLTDVKMMDNICVTKSGVVLIQEDVGNQTRLGRMWAYFPDTDRIVDVGISNARYFLSGGPNFVTQDEETSGVISAEDEIGPGYFYLNMQAHYGIPGELAEGGQLMLAYIPQTQFGPACYANCDGSTGNPALTPADFVCFLERYRTGKTYANCDISTGSPALTPADFVCYLNKFRAGCL